MEIVKPEFELILPAFNEARTLPTLVARAIQSAKEFGFTENTFQLVIVNNGSGDDSKDVLKKISEGDAKGWMQVVEVEKNQGYGHGVFTGLMNTQAPVVGWTHADFQCDPKDAFKAFLKLKGMRNSKRFVKGERFQRNPKDVFVSRVFEYVARLLLGGTFHEVNAQPKIFDRELLNTLKNPPKGFAFDLYVIYQAMKGGFQFEKVSVVFPPRIHGVSNWASSFFTRYRTILGIVKYIWSLSRTEGRV